VVAFADLVHSEIHSEEVAWVRSHFCCTVDHGKHMNLRDVVTGREHDHHQVAFEEQVFPCFVVSFPGVLPYPAEMKEALLGDKRVHALVADPVGGSLGSSDCF